MWGEAFRHAGGFSQPSRTGYLEIKCNFVMLTYVQLYVCVARFIQCHTLTISLCIYLLVSGHHHQLCRESVFQYEFGRQSGGHARRLTGIVPPGGDGDGSLFRSIN